ncbi:MAG TPA: 3'-5' exonuclease [Candidatus Limnocylindria bacterium]|nr:3'-5' exonuclease [Candidatus Limnocylindria bacterium]
MRLIVFDTETTDLFPGQICQLAYVIADGERVEGKNFFFCVDEMSEGSQEIHGFSREALAGLSCGRWFEDDAEEVLRDFDAAGLLVGHNVAFDERFLRAELRRAGREFRKVPTLCTMNFASGLMNMRRKVVTGRPKPPKLGELAQYYGVTDEMAAEGAAQWFGTSGALHDARFDTAMTWLCLRAALANGDLRLS